MIASNFDLYHLVKHISLLSCRLSLLQSQRPKAVAVATKTHPCIVLYKATGNPQEMCD